MLLQNYAARGPLLLQTNIRYLPNGFLDSTFGTGGIAQFPLPDASVADLALQGDDKILVGGTSSSPIPTALFTVVRFLPDGAVDTSYGSGGAAKVDPSGANTGGYMSGLALQGGKAVCSGQSSPAGSVVATVVRFDTNGSLDGTFGTAGVVRTVAIPGGGSSADAVAVQADQKIVVAGSASPAGGQGSALLVRYEQDGALDSTFGSGGIVVQPLSALPHYARGVLVQPNGKIVTVGYDSTLLMARFSAAGTLDTSFGTSGVVSLASYIGTARRAIIPTEGRLLMIGKVDASPNPGNDFVLAQYTATTPVELESFTIW